MKLASYTQLSRFRVKNDILNECAAIGPKQQWIRRESKLWRPVYLTAEL